MPLTHADYRPIWEQLLPGVRAALEHQREGILPEDVFCALKTQQAFLFTCEDGFVILREVSNEGWGGKDLLVWIAYSNSTGPESVIDKYETEIDEIARKAGLLGIQVASMRRGYEKALSESWHLMYRRWRKKL